MMTAAAAVATAFGADADTVNRIDSAWSKLKGPLLDAATEVCGLSKHHQWKPETWWWNEEVDNRRMHCPWFTVPWRKEAKTAYIEVKAEKEEFTTVSPDGDGIFCIVKQMDHRNQVGENWVYNDADELALTDEYKMKAWVEHYARLLDVEFEWSSNELPEVPPNAGPPPSESVTLIHKALSKMKCSQAAVPSGIIAEMLKAAGEEGVQLARQLTEAVFSCGVMPSNWEERSYGGP